MRGSSFNEEESGVGLALEQHSTRLKGMMGCPFGCSYFVYSVQRGCILLVYVGYSECSSRRHICFEEIHRCNPNQLGGFACDYVSDFPIEVNPIFAYLGLFYGHSPSLLIAKFSQGERSAIHTFWNKYPPWHPISGTNGLTLISPYAGPLFRSPRSGHWWNSYICPGDYTLSCYSVQSYVIIDYLENM